MYRSACSGLFLGRKLTYIYVGLDFGSTKTNADHIAHDKHKDSANKKKANLWAKGLFFTHFSAPNRNL